MDFGSKFVYDYCESEEEIISEDEMQEGMATSLHFTAASDDRDSSDSEEDEKQKGLAKSPPSTDSDASGTALGAVGMQRADASIQPAEQTTKARGSLFGSLMQRFRRSPLPPSEEAAPSKNPKIKEKRKMRKEKKKEKKHSWMLPTSYQESSTAQGATGGHKCRRADTNVVAVKFDHLESMCNMHTGDPTHCTQCNAVLSHLSKLTQQEDNMLWKCEFCGCLVELDICPEEQPQTADVTFLIRPAPATVASSLDDSLVIFCVDISGSMNMTTEVEGNFHLRGAPPVPRRNSNMNQFQDERIGYVSRLQCVQAAVDTQLQALQKEHPKLRVTVIGDGGRSSSCVAHQSLDDWDTLKAKGLGVELLKPIESTREALKNSVYGLDAGGMTALGPALLVAVAMATKAAGSKVIMCTDGMANLGLGSLEDSATEVYSQASGFYSDVITLAKENSTCISVITMKGTNCLLAELGRLANETGGQVNIVDPLKLTSEFSSVMADAIIATNVTASMLLHHVMYFRHEEGAENNRSERSLGSVSATTEVTFEFGMKKKGEQSTADMKDVPFQLVVHYTDRDGAEALRVITRSRPLTSDRSAAENEMNMPVVSCHAAQKSGRMASDGEYTKSRKAAMMYQRLLHRNRDIDHHVYDNYLENVAPMENYLNVHQQQERLEWGAALSEEEDADLGDEEQRRTRRSKKLSKAQQRRRLCPDDSANATYSNANIRSTFFKKK